PAAAAVTTDDAAKMLPDRVGDFRARGASLRAGLDIFKHSAPEDFAILSAAKRVYSSANGDAFSVTLVRTRSGSGAYALLTSEVRQAAQPQAIRPDVAGTAGAASPESITFFKGSTLVRINGAARESVESEALLAFARLFAETLDQGEADIPVLVKHLPDWEAAQERATYAVSLKALQKAVGDQPVLDVINFDAGTEAVTAPYGPSRLVIIEYTTPQIAADNDMRINARLNELRGQNQPVPSAYRRVGNYSVFVFGAPDENASAQLLNGVSYEQVVQWLGSNPYALERAQRRYSETTAGVILSVLKAAGLAFLLCLGIGGIFGGIVFRHRRAQQMATEIYSDAGGMIRLNIDDLTPQSDPARLLGRGNG
ncbi:MAG TPA: DUF6599 family protein, partial [Pyrinomonadaceae bacterium]|nr:DUF6599 family protein [Pyrinomonadaceae bacterium]